jgi:hypothetical protein
MAELGVNPHKVRMSRSRVCQPLSSHWNSGIPWRPRYPHRRAQPCEPGRPITHKRKPPPLLHTKLSRREAIRQRAGKAGKAASVHTHAESDVTGLVTDLAAKAAKAGDTFTGTLRIGGDQAYIECGPYQTVGGAFENMAKYSEDFSVGTWDKNGDSCSVSANNTAAPDGNTTADTITAVTTTPIIQQQVAGLASGGQYTFYVWAKVASGTTQVSVAIVDNGYAGYLAGPTSITLTTAWQRFKIYSPPPRPPKSITPLILVMQGLDTSGSFPARCAQSAGASGKHTRSERLAVR